MALTLEIRTLLGIPEIRAVRKGKTGDAQKPKSRQAYILHSLKRPEEVKSLRRIYGRAFHLIAAFANRETRVATLATKIAESRHEFDQDKYRKVAEALIQRDEMDVSKEFGQDVRDTFPVFRHLYRCNTPERNGSRNREVCRFSFWEAV